MLEYGGTFLVIRALYFSTIRGGGPLPHRSFPSRSVTNIKIPKNDRLSHGYTYASKLTRKVVPISNTPSSCLGQDLWQEREKKLSQLSHMAGWSRPNFICSSRQDTRSLRTLFQRLDKPDHDSPRNTASSLALSSLLPGWLLSGCKKEPVNVLKHTKD